MTNAEVELFRSINIFLSILHFCVKCLHFRKSKQDITAKDLKSVDRRAPKPVTSFEQAFYNYRNPTNLQ